MAGIGAELRTGVGVLIKLAIGVVALPLALCGLLLRPFARKLYIFGPTPLINLKYWSRALAKHGEPSITLVSHYYSIFDRGDFDLYYDEFLPRPLRRFQALVHHVALYPALFFIL